MKRHLSMISIMIAMITPSVFADGHQKPLSNAVISMPESSTGRLLASNCFQCHGTNGIGGFDRLAGMSQSKLFAELIEQRFKNKPKIMPAHALGYSKQQLWELSGYIASVQIKHQ
jgi:sulfide dehydrogenase cytochrome subunit